MDGGTDDARASIHTTDSKGRPTARVLADALILDIVDPPKGETRFVAHPDGFAYANELVEFIRSRYSLCIGGAAYPEKHPESPNADLDLDNLKRKVDAGAEFLVTQLFFENDAYFRFVERCRKVGMMRLVR